MNRMPINLINCAERKYNKKNEAVLQRSRLRNVFMSSVRLECHYLNVEKEKQRDRRRRFEESFLTGVDFLRN